MRLARFVLLTWLLAIALSTFVQAATDDAEPQFSADDLEFFEKRVRPILVARCYECHSGQTTEPKGGLRVDSRPALLKGGDTGAAIVVRDPKKSLLVDAINYGELYQMPPKTRLPPEEVAVLTQWVERGAPWHKEQPATVSAGSAFDLEKRKAAHWCWRPVQHQAPPVVQDPSWPKQDVDRFILAKLEQHGLSPAPPADRRTLIRRVYLDLIGLPPSADEVEAFVQDGSERAYERVVDRLLQSPHFGERWARHWMDLVRYAETCGHEFDFPIHNAWRYRDYLIRAFNSDLPYDQLVMEHIAGDLLTAPRMHPTEGYNESMIGTGFWFLHEATHAPVDVRGDEAVRVDNQIDVLSKTFLGLTVACARCHDHKFDAISTKDYYALAGFVQSSRRQEAMLDPRGQIHSVAAWINFELQRANAAMKTSTDLAFRLSADQFAKYLLAAREVLCGEPRPGETPAEQGHRRHVARVAEEFSVDPVQLTMWVRASASDELDRTGHPLHAWKKLALRSEVCTPQEFATWQHTTRESRVDPEVVSKHYQRFADFESSYAGWFVTGEAFGNQPTQLGQWDVASSRVKFAQPGVAHSGQISPKLQGVLRSPTFMISSRNIFYRVAGTGCEVRMIVDGYTMVEFQQLLFAGMKFPIGENGREGKGGKIASKAGDEFIWHRQSGDLGMYLGHRAHLEIIDHGDGWAAIDGIWFSDRDTPPATESAFYQKLAEGKEIASAAEFAQRIGEGWRETLLAWKEGGIASDDVELMNWVLTVIPEVDSNSAGKSPAETIAAARRQIDELTKELPAPIRVTAIADGTGRNERVLIRGNPRTPGDEVPRRLLQSLASDLPVLSDGSGRLTLARQIADSANPLTARVMVNRVWHHLFGRGVVPSVDNFGVMGDKPTHPELLDYLASQFVEEGWSIKRLMRGLVLSRTYQMSSHSDPRAADIDPTNEWLHCMRVRRLEGEVIRDAMLKISGRFNETAFGPSVPVHITPFMQGRGKPATSGPVDGEGRRSVYLEVRRNFLPPMMMAFDTPIPFNPVGRRNVSNVPAQALILMNDPFVIEQSKQWSSTLLSNQSLSFGDRIQRAYLAAYARPPEESEQAYASEFFTTQARLLNISDEQSLTHPQIWADYCHVLFNMKEFVFVH